MVPFNDYRSPLGIMLLMIMLAFAALGFSSGELRPEPSLTSVASPQVAGATTGAAYQPVRVQVPQISIFAAQ